MVRTRFAPSPTGYLHIGGVRTALFNWLFARRHGGRFVLRIDDTDASRNVDAALEPILEGFRWLGLDWDEGPGVDGSYGPYYQSQRQARYAEAADELIRRDRAYVDYATPDELAVERDAAREAGRRFIYSRRFMASDDESRARFEAEGRQGVVRLKMPREGRCRFDDLVRGEVEVEWAAEQDHVIRRADGSCLYHLASVVDDHAMAISHVIRAEEHLSNTPRQIFIARGLGYELPVYAHLPVVAEPGSKTKLSKRKLDKYLKHAEFAKLNERGLAIATAIGHEVSAETFNPVVVDFYRETGFLPDALVNALLLLGWALDDRTERFTREAMIEHFSLERVNRAAAGFDPAKLLAIQARWMQERPIDERVAMTRPFLERAGLLPADPTPDQLERLRRIVEYAGDRITIAGDVLDFADFFVDDDELSFDDAAFDKRLRRPEGAAALVRRFAERLAAAESFDPESIETLTARFVDDEGIKLGGVMHPVRVAVTGKPVGFGFYETLSVLGRGRALARIERALARL